MSFLTKILGGAGKLLGKIAPVASVIPGVGPVAAAGLAGGAALAAKLAPKARTLLPAVSGLGRTALGLGAGVAAGEALDYLQGESSVFGGAKKKHRRRRGITAADVRTTLRTLKKVNKIHSKIPKRRAR